MKKLLIILSSSALVGCASSKNPNDPYENYNRPVFEFNMTVDHYVLRPVTVGYTYIPDPIREALGNFYNNLRDFVSLANDILQLDGIDTMQTTMRIALNSTFGILGLIDVSSSMGLPQYTNTFGNTLKRWGWTDSSYFLVPFLGPATVRDQLGIIPDVYFNPLFYIINDPWISWSIFGINLLDQRSKYLGQDELLEQTLDPYATIRDLYLQKNGAYKYATESNDNNTESENIDNLISEENGESSPQIKPQANNNDSEVDNLINEENLALSSGISQIRESTTKDSVNTTSKLNSSTPEASY
ncbi:MAG: phospholipid-binding lipoprotein MlaA [Pseudomonadota bacterium]|jgi:phospholipid-binding lipoprotein MlaA|nr:VacJ family lipoprotein [Burkholderiales bacterium]MBP9768208.1 VacJ family lipoprotein [Burkholderiales bacterium]MDQ5948146.1 phospholipid-binding lipoprotein MlaA [Pseudomonadota bacterium]HCY38576.1 ABC transporter [Neisseriales bacterium]